MAPLNLNSPTPIVEAPVAVSVHCVETVIETPVEGAQTVRYTFQAFNADGDYLGQFQVGVQATTLAAEKPDVFPDVAAAIKADAYERAQAYLGEGGTIT